MLRVARPGERPVFLFTPLVGTHDKNLHRLRIRKTIRDVLEKVVVPVQGYVVFVELRLGAKVHISDLAAGPSMPSDRDHQPLSLTRRLVFSVQPYANEVAQRPSKKDVVPRRDR